MFLDPADADRAADVPSQQPPNMQVFIGNRFPARQESYTSKPNDLYCTADTDIPYSGEFLLL